MRSIAFIRVVHTAIFLLLSALLAALLYEVVADRLTSLTWIAVTLFTVEGIVLMLSGWKCPLTAYAESLGADHGQVTDIILPKWLADRVFILYGGAFAIAILLLGIRLVGRS